MRLVGPLAREGPNPKTAPARLSKPEVVDTYRRTAPIYDLWASLTETSARARSLELARVTDGERILEVAVGTGGTFLELLKRNPTGFTEGVDLTDAMLERAEEKARASGYSRYRLRIGDASKLDFDDAAFNLVVNSYMFDLLPEEEFGTVLKELRRVLEPGGRLLLVNMARAWRFPQGLYSLIYRINPRWMGGCRGVELCPHLKDAGFALQHHERISQLAFPSEIILATAA